MATGFDNYMQVAQSMDRDEAQKLLDSVAQYDSATRNKIIKAHLDAKALQMGISGDSAAKQAAPAPMNNRSMGEDPMLSQQKLDKQLAAEEKISKLFKTQQYQKTQRFSATEIGPNMATTNTVANASDATKAGQKINQQFGPGSLGKTGPAGETVRQNSKGQLYYINANGNAVIV